MAQSKQARWNHVVSWCHSEDDISTFYLIKFVHNFVITKILSYGLNMFCDATLTLTLKCNALFHVFWESRFMSHCICMFVQVSMKEGKILAHLAETSMLINLSGIQYGAHEWGLISWAAYLTALVKIDTTFYTKATFIIHLLQQTPTGLFSRHSLGFFTMSLCASSHQRQQTLWFSVLKNTLHVSLGYDQEIPKMRDWTNSSKVLWRKDTVGGKKRKHFETTYCFISILNFTLALVPVLISCKRQWTVCIVSVRLGRALRILNLLLWPTWGGPRQTLCVSPVSGENLLSLTQTTIEKWQSGFHSNQTVFWIKLYVRALSCFRL